MTTATTTTARSSVRPGASWTGWVGYTPTVRGPEARLARARAAGLIAPPAPKTCPGAVRSFLNPGAGVSRRRTPRGVLR